MSPSLPYLILRSLKYTVDQFTGGVDHLSPSGPLGTEEYVEYTGVIHDSGHHLLSIINDILDISRIETDTFELNEEPFDLSSAIAACVRIS